MTQLFDNYSDSYGAIVQSSIDFSGLPHSFFMQTKADLLRDVFRQHFGTAKPAGLDVGCGVGALHPYIRDNFSALTGVDVSADSIAQAQSANGGISYDCYDGQHLPAHTGAVDATMTVCVMHHVPPGQWTSFMHEVRRVTRPGGLVCVIEHNPFNPLTRLAVHRCPFDRDAVLLSARKTERLMRAAGLQSVRSQFFVLVPSAARLARRIERALSEIPLGGQYLTCGIA